MVIVEYRNQQLYNLVYFLYTYAIRGKKKVIKKTVINLFVIICIFGLPLISQAFPSGNTYDSNGRLVTSYQSGVGTIHYTYDRNGNLLRREIDNNLLTNGGFENYTEGKSIADGWSMAVEEGATYNYEVIKQASGGKTAQKVSAGSLGKSDRAYLYQDISVDGNKDYALSSRIHIPELSQAKVFISLNFIDMKGTLLGGGFKELDTNTPDYRTVTFEGVTPVGATWARLHFFIEAQAENGLGTFYIDEVDLRYGTKGN